jgi:hypothetical protein
MHTIVTWKATYSMTIANLLCKIKRELLSQVYDNMYACSPVHITFVYTIITHLAPHCMYSTCMLCNRTVAGKMAYHGSNCRPSYPVLHMKSTVWFMQVFILRANVRTLHVDVSKYYNSVKPLSSTSYDLPNPLIHLSFQKRIICNVCTKFEPC